MRDRQAAMKSRLSGRERKVLFALVLADSAAGVETTLVLTAMAKLAMVFGSPSGVSWLLTGYLLMSAASSAIAPSMGDVLGRKKVILAVLGLCFIGSCISALSADLPYVIAGRVLQGMSGALLPLCIGLAREQMEPENVEFGVGVLAGVASLASAVGFLLAGWLIDHAPWQYLFITGGAVALIAAVAAAWALPPSVTRLPFGDLDLVGGLLFAPAVALFLLFVNKGHDWGWTHPLSLASLGLALAILAVWLGLELKHPRPLIDLRLLGRPAVLAANGCIFLAGIGALQPQLVLSLLQQAPATGAGLGLSASGAAAVMAIGQFMGAGASVMCGKIARRCRGTTILFASTLFLLGGWTIIIAGQSSVILASVGYIVLSIGIGALMSAVAIVIVAEVPAARTSESSGLTAISRSVGTAIGAQIIYAIFAAKAGQGHIISQSAYGWAFTHVLLFCAINVVLGLAIVKARKPTALVTG